MAFVAITPSDAPIHLNEPVMMLATVGSVKVMFRKQYFKLCDPNNGTGEVAAYYKGTRPRLRRGSKVLVNGLLYKQDQALGGCTLEIQKFLVNETPRLSQRLWDGLWAPEKPKKTATALAG